MANYTITTYTATELGTDTKLQVTGAVYNNSTTITHDSISGITQGMSVVGSGIPVGATVSNVSPSNTSFTLSEATTGGGQTGQTLILTNITTPTLLITPAVGYVVRAFDFKIHNASRGAGADINKWTGGDLSSISAVESVRFVDLDPNYTGFGYSEANTIRVEVNLANNFSISNQNHNISLDIDGKAHLPQDVAVSVPIDFDLLASLTGINYNITSLASGLTWTNNSDGSSLSAATQETNVNISGNIDVTPEQQADGQAQIAEITFDVVEADLTETSGNIDTVVIEENQESDPTTEDNNVQESQPGEQPGGGFTPIFTGGSSNVIDAGILTMTPKTIDVDPTEDLPTEVTYSLMLNTSKRLLPGQKSTFNIKAKALSTPPVPVNKLIKSVDFGKSTVSVDGERRVMKVFGDIGAKMSIGIFTDTGTIGTQDGAETDDIFKVVDAELKSSTTSARGQGVFTFTAVFPATSTTKNYGLQITAGSGSAFSSNINQGAGNVYDYTFQQFANPTITINATSSHTGGNPNYASQLADLQITKTGIANTLGSALNSVKGRTDDIKIDWTLNGVSGSPSVIQPLILENSIQTGGFANGLTGWTATTSGNSTIVAVTDSGGNYVERTGNDSADVSITKTGAFVVGETYVITLEYSGQNKAGGQVTIKAGATSSGAQNLVQGDVATRKTITTTLKATTTNVVQIEFNQNSDSARFYSLTWKQASSFTNSDPSLNGGTDIRLIDSSTSVDGTTVKINGTLKVERYGNSNVTMDVDVGKLFSIVGN